jgi:hypothetical protein
MFGQNETDLAQGPAGAGWHIVCVAGTAAGHLTTVGLRSPLGGSDAHCPPALAGFVRSARADGKSVTVGINLPLTGGEAPADSACTRDLRQSLPTTCCPGIDGRPVHRGFFSGE